MKVIDKNGNVLLEKDTHPMKAKRSSLRVKKHAQGMHKTTAPVTMTVDEYFDKVRKALDKRYGYITL